MPRPPAARLALAFLLAAAPLAAQPPDDAGFRGEERVTAIDLVVELEGAGARAGDAFPRDVGAGDFTVTTGGETRRVVAVEAGPEPWRTVLYFDLGLLADAGVAWAVDALVPHVPRLVELGTVEVIAAREEPERVLAAVRDADLVTAALAQLAHGQATPEDAAANVQLAVRHEVLDALDAPDPEVDPVELVRLAVRDEVERLRARLDHLLLAMSDAQPTRGRRALFYVGDGFDLDPLVFYRDQLPGATLDPATAEAVDALAEQAEATARTLAAYGWVTVAVAPPEPDRPLKRGVRIGKWRFALPRGDENREPPPQEEGAPDPIAAAKRTDPVVESAVGEPVAVPIVVARRESDRDPEKARSYLDLAHSLLVQGKLDDAEEAAERALHHYYDDPRTANEQAAAFALLGQVHEARGELDEAREAYALAAGRDPELALAEAPRQAHLLTPAAPLAAIAGATAGALVRTPEGVGGAVDRLGRRLRVTYQVAGPPAGRLLPVEVRFARGGWTVRQPAWARTATPDAVAAARLRRLLDGDLLTGSFDVEAELRPDADGRSGGELRLVVPGSVAPEAEGLPETLLRVSLAQGGPDVAPAIRHDLFAPRARGEDWRYATPVELPAARPWLAVVVEDLDTGRWGGALVEAR